MGIVSRLIRKHLVETGELTKLNILTCPTHEAYETNLCKTGHEFFAVRGQGIKDWETKYRPLPDNYTLLNKDLPAVDFDLVLCQNRFGQYPVLAKIAQELHLPLICLEHTLPVPNWPFEHKMQINNMKGFKNLYISEFSLNAWGVQGDVLHHGIDTELFNNKNQVRQPVLLSVCNDWINRDWCMPAGQRILTKNGYVPIENIKIGMEVLTDSGHFYNVTKIFNRKYVGPMYTFTLDNMKKQYSFTSNHGIRVFRNNQWQYITASRVKVGDILKFPHIQRKNWTFTDKNMAWLIGLILGDGSISNEGNISICLHENEIDIAEKARKILEEITGKSIISHRHRSRGKKAITVESTSKIFATWLKQEIGSKNYEKKIPDFIFFGCDEVRLECIKGLFEADGHLKNKGTNLDKFVLSSISVNLASQFMAICTNMGLSCKFKKKEQKTQKSNGLPCFIYCVTGYGQDNVKNFVDLIINNSIKTPYQYIVSKVECNDEWSGDVYNCEVSEDHSYVVEPGFVVHNCCGFNLWKNVTQGLPVKPVGATPGLSEPAKSVDELIGFYNSHDIFLNTSLVSPVPTSLMEAMACGCAVVSTNTCMIPEVIEHGVNGFMGKTPDELRFYCEKLLANPDLCRKMGEAARKTIQDKFGLEKFVQKWNNIFLNTVKEWM